jgi:hypothetical protein
LLFILGDDGAFLLFGHISSERDKVCLFKVANEGIVEERYLVYLVLRYYLYNLARPQDAIHVLGEYYIFEAEFRDTVH